MGKTKVLHIITKLELGGAQRNTLFTVKNLDRDRFEAAVVAGPGGILDEEAGRIVGVKFIVAPHLTRKINPATDILALAELVLIIRREKPDIVHTHSSKAGILGRLAAAMCNVTRAVARRPRIKIVHTFHGFGFTPAQSKVVRAVFALLEKLAAFVSDSLIFVSEANMREAASRGIGATRKYTLIRSGVDAEFFRNFRMSDDEKRKVREDWGAGPDDRIISTIGPFKKQKNHGDFIAAAAMLKSRGYKIRAVLAGDGEGRRRLASLARGLDVEKEVVFAGWLDGKTEVARLLKASDVFLMTSLWEGLPRALVEAAAAGVPVCANAVDGITDLITHGVTGLLAPPGDAGAAAANVARLLDDAAFAAAMAAAARSRIDDTFDIKNMILAQEKLYDALMGRG